MSCNIGPPNSVKSKKTSVAVALSPPVLLAFHVMVTPSPILGTPLPVDVVTVILAEVTVGATA